MIYLDLIVNLTLLVALSLVSGFIEKRWPRHTRAGVILQGFVFGGTAVLGMLRPVNLGPGLIFDGRSVMVSLAALFYGPWAGGLAAGMTIACRVTLGGTGLLTGSLVILSSAVIGLLVRWRLRPETDPPSAQRLYLFGIAVHLAMLALMFTLPGGAGWAVVQRIGLPVILIYPLATILAGKILSDQVEAGRRVKALAQSEEKYRLVVENAGEAISVAQDGKLVFANAKTEELTGYTADHLRTKPFGELIHPEDRDLVAQRHVKRMRGETLPSRYSFRIVQRAGQMRWVELNVVVVQWEGRPATLNFISDITERKQAEAERERLLLAIEQAAEGVVITDPAGAIQYVNPAFARIAGYGREEVIGQNQRILKSGVHDDRFYRDLWATIAGGKTFTGRMVNKRKDGTLYTVEETISPVRDPASGRIVNYVGVKRDITRELELEKRAAQVQRTEAIGTLAGGIAHDFNNILFPIIGMSEMLIEDLPAGSPEHEQAVEIFKAARRAGDLVKQILAFSRQVEIRKMPVRVPSVLKEVIGLARAAIPADIAIASDIQADCGLVMADPTQLHQVMMNLITNAFHAAEGTGGQINVGLRQADLSEADVAGTVLLPGAHVELTVADTGQGIDPAVMPRIFEPYFTTKQQGKGTGLGLSVVFGIVRDHGGDIRVASQPGKGARFTVWLPLLKDAGSQAVAEKPAAMPARANERVLLVDDEAAIVRLEKLMLERLGYRVEDHVSSIDALAAFRVRPDAFDLVITDMTMPNMTGDRLAREVLAIRPDIAVIICTGFSERLDDRRAAAMGIRGFLMKPVVMGEMAAKIREALEKGRDEG